MPPLAGSSRSHVPSVAGRVPAGSLEHSIYDGLDAIVEAHRELILRDSPPSGDMRGAIGSTAWRDRTPTSI